MRLLALLIACIFAAVFTTLLVSLAIQSDGFGLQFADSQELPYFFMVDEVMGFDVQTDVLRLGAVIPGAVSRRNITLSGTPGTVLRLDARGQGSDYISFSHNPVELVNSSVDVQVRVSPARNASFGNYSGVIYITTVNN